MPATVGTDELRHRLGVDGVVIVVADSPARFVERAESLGTLEDHDGTGLLVWDVTDTAGSEARSHGVAEFEPHTDCSYLHDPPELIGMHVLQQDTRGGGVTALLPASAALDRLPVAVRAALAVPFPINVPPEFRGAASGELIQAPIVDGTKVRFRRDLLCATSTESERAAFDAFDAAVRTAPAATFTLPNTSSLYIDNHRWLHSRSEVRDPTRHLLRVRIRTRP